MTFGKRGLDGFKPGEITGYGLIEGNFIRAGLSGPLSEAQQILADTTRGDEVKLKEITEQIRESINKVAGSNIGNRVTEGDVRTYIRNKMQRD